MLSSVSYVCSGMCAGMWVISAYIFGGTRSSFLSVLLFQRSNHFFLFLTFCYVCVCVLCAFILQMFLALNVVGYSGCGGSPVIWCFTIPSKFSSGCCVG